MPPSTARLEMLRKLIKSDLEALPDRPASPETEYVSDEEPTGGVSLEPSAPSIKQPLSESPVRATNAASPSKEQQVKTPPTSEPPSPIVNPERRFVWVKGAESTYNLGAAPNFSPLPPSELPPTDLKKCELAPAEKYFTPILALSKYPYLFCNKDCMQDIASAFFDAGKFWAREWDLYYVWDIEETKPLILVGETQFKNLLKEINSVLDLGLRITDQQREDGLVSRFPDHPRCRPRYLGRSHSRDEYDTMVQDAPSANTRPAGEAVPPTLDGRTLQEFKEMIEESWELQKKKNKASKEKKRLDRLGKQKVFADQFKRSQRYLGLRPVMKNDQNPSALPSAVDTSSLVPFTFDRSVVFICVDVESYEKAHHKITEIGIATLDTRDLASVAPGKDGENWRSIIKARHFRITDHAHMVNSEFVTGCPDRFDFGRSEWVRLADAPAMVAACFKPPFCNRVDQGAATTMMEVVDLDEQRNLIFLGHDTLGDVRYLQQLGFDPLTLPNLLEAQDTATMYRVWRREQQPTKLGNILYDFDIAGFNLHNAGNDAVFTVQAMLGICVREASIRGSPEMKDMRDEQTSSRVAIAQEEAKQQVEDEATDWDVNDTNGDGGLPVPIDMPAPAKVITPRLGNMSGPREGRGGLCSRGRGEPCSNGGSRGQDSLPNSSGRGGYRSQGRPQPNGRGRGDRGRGRGRDGSD